MSDDLYAQPDLRKKTRFQIGEKEDTKAEICEKSFDLRIYDNPWVEENSGSDLQENPAGNQQQATSVGLNSEKIHFLGAAGGILSLLSLFLLAAVIFLSVQWIQDKSSWKEEKDQMWRDNLNLSSMSDKLLKNYDELKGLNADLTQNVTQIEEEKSFLKAVNDNVTKERDELRKKIETMSCPAGWMKFGARCYLISETKENWIDSKTFCENHEADLVIISSSEEQKFFTSLGLSVWIGLTFNEKEEIWKWVDGTPLATKYWESSQPNNKGDGRRNENCVSIQTWGNQLENWHDYDCMTLRRFICEKMFE